MQVAGVPKVSSGGAIPVGVPREEGYGEDSIFVIGTSFKTAPIEFREALLRFTSGRKLPSDGSALLESVPLMTCNRMEYYFYATDPEVVRQGFFSSLPARLKTHSSRFYVLVGRDAIKHLFELAAGLDSMVIGEDQILSQIRDAGRLARTAGSSRAVLSTLFDAAYGAGGRVRTAGIVRGGKSVSSFAVGMASKLLGRTPRRVLLIGGGEVTRLAASELEGCELLLASRGRKGALESFPGKLVTYKDVSKVAQQCDLIISATKMGGQIIKASQLPEDADRVILDLAFPRNIDPRLKGSRRNKLLDLDDLAAMLRNDSANLVSGRAESTIEREVTTFRRWLAASRLSASLPRLYRWAEVIRDTETQQALRRLPKLSPQERKIVEIMGRRLVSKLLAPATRFSKNSTEELSQSQRLAILEAIFEVQGE